MAALATGGVTGFMAAPGAGAVSMFFGTDPGQPNLTNMVVEKYPQLKGPVSDFLATDPNDNEALNRLRHATEGLVTGAAAEAIVRGLSATRSFIKAKMSPGAPPAEMPIPGSPAGAAPDEQLAHADYFVKGATGGVAPDAPAVAVSVGKPAASPAGSAQGVPVSTSLTVPPPGTQAPLTKLSTLPEPSSSSTSRSAPPPTRTGPSTTLTGEFELGGIDTPTGRIITQASGDSKAILAASEQVKPEVERALADIADSIPGAKVAVSDVAPNGVRVKTAQGVAEKVASGRPAQLIGDYIGARLAVDSPQTAANVLDDLGRRFKVLAVDDKIAAPKDGYRAIHAQVEVAPGLSAEIQIVPKEINAVQEQLHHVYDKFKRVVDPTPQQMIDIAAMKADLVKQFDAAWEKQPWDVATAKIGTPGQVTGKAAIESAKAVKLSDLNVNVTWENIDKGNLPGVIGDIAGQMKTQISAAKRDVLTLQAQKQLAEALNMTHEDLLKRGIGEAFPAEKIIAAGKLLQASDARLLDLARKAEVSSEAFDAFRVNEQMVTHMALLEQFLGVSGEAGRALGALRAVHQEGAVARAQMMQSFLEGTGGIEGAKRLSSMIVDLKAQGAPAGALNVALNRGWGRWTWDAYKEAYALGFLWRPVTQVRNLVGNTANAMWQSVDRKVAEKYAMMLGTDPAASVAPGEAAAYLRGQLGAFKEAWVTAGKAVSTGERQFFPMQSLGPMEADLSRGGGQTMAGSMQPTITSKAVAETMRKSAVEAQAFAATPMGKAIDMIGHTVRMPGRFLAAGDDFFKVIAYRGEIEAQAYRRALAEGLQGNAFADRVASLISNPGDEIKLAAMSHANYATFNDMPGKWGTSLLQLRSNVQPIYMAMPYVRTPSNLLRNAVEHSPMAPIIGRWRTDFGAGGAARELALAKMTTGAVAMALLLDYAHNGNLTGPLPNDQGWKESLEGMGIKPFALQRPGGAQVQISGLGQLAPMIAFAGTMDQVMKSKDVHPEAYDTWDEWLNTAISIAAYSTTGQSFMTGMSKLMGSLDTYKKGSDTSLGTFMRDLGSSSMNVIPGVAPARAIGQAMDPQQREIDGWWSALFYKNMPLLSDRMIPIRDVFGHQIEPSPKGVGGALYNMVVPFRLNWKNDHATFNELVNLRTGIQRIEWKAPFMGVQVNFRDHPEVLDYYRRLAGNELQHNPVTGEKIGLEDFLNRMVSGGDPRYSYIYEKKSGPDVTGTDSGKAAYIKHWVQEYRVAAQRQIMSEAPWRFPAFHAEIQAGIAHREHQKLTIPRQDLGLEDRRTARRTENVRPIQEPLPDHRGRPAVVGGGGFTVPSQ
jgi:hypothetical protein